MNRNIIIIAIISSSFLQLWESLHLHKMQRGDEIGMLNTQIKFLSQETIKTGQVS